MKKRPFLLFVLIAFLINLYSCQKEENNNNPGNSSTGYLLIYTLDTTIFRSCGPLILVSLNTGQQSVITNYYTSVPRSCTNTFGGYFSLPPGDYTYTATTIGACDTIRGFAHVDSGLCTHKRIR